MTHCHTIIQDLREMGYRITPQREMIIEAIAHNASHMTAEEVLGAVRERSQAVSLSTIYRTLDFLVENGLCSRTDLGGGHVIYATLKHGPHLHLVCRTCGQVMEIEGSVLSNLESLLLNRHGFSADLHHLSLYGVCQACQAKLQPQAEQNSLFKNSREIQR
jgi:Fur family ferric uptake transcriptional regulator